MASRRGQRRVYSVLVVEDENRVAWVIRAILERSGFDVTVASSIAEAHELGAGLRLDAIVVDFILPDGDGLGFARQMRASHGAAVVVMSGLTGLPDAGDIVMLTKPFTPEHLEQALALAPAKSPISG